MIRITYTLIRRAGAKPRYSIKLTTDHQPRYVHLNKSAAPTRGTL